MITDLPFCGREAELATLDACWRRASDVENPQPQLVLLAAEPGVGKTRLVLEFLRRQVAELSDPPGYWPDPAGLVSDRLHLNFAPDQCRFDGPIPFLWWGIAAQAGGGDSVALHDRFLAPHLVAMSMRARMAGTGASLAKIWAGAGVDALAGALQVDTILSVGGAFLDSVKLLQGEIGKGAAQASAGDTLVKNRVDALLADLEQVLNPAARLGYARVPAMILIDDAQFAAADAGLLRFVERLTHAAMTQRWPVMFVMTHWQTEWALDADRGGRSVATLVHHARHGGSDEPGPISGTPGGYLNSENYREIALAKLDDLDPALRSALPGLPADQRGALLGAVDGNPRFLEQVIAYLRAEPRLFDDFDPARALTDEGLAEALVRSQRVHEVVLARLTAAHVAPEVREALALASVQGMRVVRKVVEAAGQALLGHDLGEPLMRGQNPFSVMAFDSDGVVGGFTERLFLQAAGQLRRNIKGLHDEAAVKAALRPALQKILGDLIDADAGRGRHHAIATAAQVAATLIDQPSDFDQRVLAALAASAQMLTTDERDTQTDALLRLFNAAYDGMDEDASVQLLGALPHEALVAAAETAIVLNRRDFAKWLGGRRYEWLNRVHAGQVTPEAAVPLAVWIALLGDVAGLEGRYDDAIARLGAARQYYEFAMERQPSRPAVSGLTGVLLILGRFEGAKGDLRAAVQILAQIRHLHESARQAGVIDETEERRGVALSLESSIDPLDAVGDMAASTAAEAECLLLTRRLADGGDLQDRSNLSRLLNRLAAKADDFETAIGLAHESVDIIYAVLADAPSRIAAQRDLVVARTVRARIFDRADRMWERRSDLAEALAVADQIHDRIGDAETADMLRASLRNLIEAHAQAGDPVRARPLLVRLIALCAPGSPERDPAERALEQIDQMLAAAGYPRAPTDEGRDAIARGAALVGSGDLADAFDAYAAAFDVLLPQLNYTRDEADLQVVTDALDALLALAPRRAPPLSEEERHQLVDRALLGVVALLRMMRGAAALRIINNALAFLSANGFDYRGDEFREARRVVQRVVP